MCVCIYIMKLLFVILLIIYNINAKIPTNKEELEQLHRKKTFDYVIVGGGNTGCVIARRLSDNPNFNVLLLEEGADAYDNDYLKDLIIRPRNIFYTWEEELLSDHFRSIPSSSSYGRQIDIRRGRQLGGTSSINGGLYTRPWLKDFDLWGVDGFTSSDFERAYLKLENHPLKSPVHGTGGPVPIERSNVTHQALQDPALQAGRELNISVINDSSNGVGRYGLAPLFRVLRKGHRIDAYTAYIRPILPRKNLYVRPYSKVIQIINQKTTENKLRATGVIYSAFGLATLKVQALREVIISAGVWGSPQLLLLSGIGPRDDLQQLGIDLKQDLPVGKYLKTRPAVNIIMLANTTFPEMNLTLLASQKTLDDFNNNGEGVLTLGPSCIYSPMKSNNNLQHPDFIIDVDTVVPRLEAPPNAFLLFCSPADVKSEGWMKLRSPNPWLNPLVDLQLFNKSEDMDGVFACIDLARRMYNTSAFRDWIDWENGPELAPGIDIKTYSKEMREFFKAQGYNTWHTMSTCPMRTSPNDPKAVVDEHLRVIGFENLRVADASVFPSMIRSGPMSVCYALGELAAEKILNNIEDAVCYDIECGQEHHYVKQLSVQYFLWFLAIFTVCIPFVAYLLLRIGSLHMNYTLKSFQLTNENNYTLMKNDGSKQLLDDNPSDNFSSLTLAVCFFNYTTKHHTTKQQVQLLNNISVSFCSGEICGILGASGSGKTTLLRLMANQVNEGVQDGIKLFSENDSIKSTHKVEFVQSDDELIENITVRETLQYYALLQIPDISYEEVHQRTFAILNELGLLSCADLRIESISSGQKKRVAIAVHLLTEPRVLLLDEPTSSLDASSSMELMQYLRKLTIERHCIIALTVHQPRSEIFFSFDNILMLSSFGSQAYFGPPDLAVNFLGNVAKKVDESNEIVANAANPADFCLDMLNSDKMRIAAVNAFDRSFEKALIERDICRLYELKTLKKYSNEDLENPLLDDSQSTVSAANFANTKRNVDWWTALVTLVSRFHRSHNFLLVHSFGVGTFVLALFVMSLYYQLGNTNLQEMEYRCAAYFVYIIISLNLAFFQIAGVYVPREYHLYQRERDDKIARASVFQMFMFLRDQWIIVLGMTSFFVLYYGVGFRGGFLPVMQSYMLVVLFVLVMQGWAVKIQMALRAKLEHGLLAQGIWMGVNVMFAGFLVRMQDLSTGWHWLPYLMGSFWCLGPLMVIELRDLPMSCSFGVPEELCSDGNTVIQQLGYEKADIYLGLIYFVVLIWLDRAAGLVAQVFWDTRSKLRIKAVNIIRVEEAKQFELKQEEKVELEQKEISLNARRKRTRANSLSSIVREQRAQQFYKELTQHE